MTSDGRPPQANETPAADNAPTDPPAYREAATPEEVEEAQEEDDKGSGS